MVEEEAYSKGLNNYKRLRLSLLETTLIGAMLVAVVVAGLDAIEGEQVGKSDALAVAKLQGQQELMASRLK